MIKWLNFLLCNSNENIDDILRITSAYASDEVVMTLINLGATSLKTALRQAIYNDNWKVVSLLENFGVTLDDSMTSLLSPISTPNVLNYLQRIRGIY